MEIKANYSFCPYDAERLVVGDLTPDKCSYCPKCGFVDYQNPKPCVAVLITRCGSLLLARRGIEPAYGKWDIPGGFVNSGETAEEAAIRETEEETSLRVKVVDFLGSFPDVYGPKCVPTVNFCFVAEIISGCERAKSDVISLEWFSSQALPEGDMAFSHQIKIIRRWRQLSSLEPPT